MIGNKHFLPNCLLSTLLVLLLLATEITCFVRLFALNDQTYLTIMEEQNISARVQDSLTEYFTTQESTTSIPADVYLSTITDEEIHDAICANITNAFDYLFGRTDSLKTEMDFTELEQNVEQFFSDYAASIDYEKDEAYDKKVKATISVAEKEILAQADVFKFQTLNQAGLFKTARRLIPYLDTATIGCVVLSILLCLILLLINRKAPRVLLYWYGCALTVSSVLPLIPLIYMKATDYFSAFVIKSARIYAAVTGSLNKLTNGMLLMFVISLAIGVILINVYAITAAASKKADQTNTEEPAE